MKIKKLIKKEDSRKKRRVVISLGVMVLMTFIVISLREENLFNSWELYFAYAFLVVVDGLLLINVFKIVLSNIFEFNISEQRLRIKDGLFKASFSVNLDNIAYVDVYERDREDFEVLVLIDKGKRNKNLLSFNKEFLEDNPGYKNVYEKLKSDSPEDNYYCYIMKKKGAYKYYYLYMLYKKSYNSEFSKAALQYVKSFVEEYNLQ